MVVKLCFLSTHGATLCQVVIDAAGYHLPLCTLLCKTLRVLESRVGQIMKWQSRQLLSVVFGSPC